MHTNEPTATKHRDRLHRALSTSSLHELTEEEVLLALREEGIESLEGLVSRLLEDIRRSARESESPESGIDLQLQLRAAPRERSSNIVHRVPEVPFLLNGVEYEPKDIRRFDGRALDFLLSRTSEAESILVAIEEGDALSRWLENMYVSVLAGVNTARTMAYYGGYAGAVHNSGAYSGPGRGGGGMPAGIPPGTEVRPRRLMMSEHVGNQGAKLALDPGRAFPDLTKVKRSCFLVSCSNWNDVISHFTSTSTLCVFWEHINYGGARLVVPANTPVLSLPAIGWNDRISSVANFG